MLVRRGEVATETMEQFDISRVKTADVDLMRAIREKMDLLDDDEQRKREELAPRPGWDMQCALLAVVVRTTWPGITAADIAEMPVSGLGEVFRRVIPQTA